MWSEEHRTRVTKAKFWVPLIENEEKGTHRNNWFLSALSLFIKKTTLAGLSSEHSTQQPSQELCRKGSPEAVKGR